MWIAHRPLRHRPARAHGVCTHGNGLFQTRESAGAINRLLFSPSEAQFEAVPPGRPPRRAMAPAQGAPGASLVSLVTASLRNARHLHARTPEEGETPPCAGRRDIFSSASASSFPRARPSVTASPSPTTTPAPGLPDRVHIAFASSSDRRSVARGDAHVGPPGDDTRAAGGKLPQPVHSYFARQLEGCGDRPAHALEMLRDAPAYLRRNRLVEMKKAAKAEATRKRLHSLLEAGEALSERNFPGLAYTGNAHATGPETSSGERELRRLFPGGALYVDERPRAMLSNVRSSFDDDDEEDEEDTEDEDSEGETEDVKTEKETQLVTHAEPPPKLLPKRRERPNESATAAAARYANSAVPTAPPRTLPFIAGGIQVIAIGSVVPELSGRFSAQVRLF